MNQQSVGVARGTLVAFALALALLPAASRAQLKQKQWEREPEMKIDKSKVYVARLDTTAGPIVLELYPKLAPHHVNNFVFLSKEGFYNGVIFHRVIPGFMIQGGDPTGTGMGGPGYEIKAELSGFAPVTRAQRGGTSGTHGSCFSSGRSSPTSCQSSDWSRGPSTS